MTRKDYRMIANTIKPIVEGVLAIGHQDHYRELAPLRELVNTLSDRLQEDNPRFNRIKFWEACGL